MVFGERSGFRERFCIHFLGQGGTADSAKKDWSSCADFGERTQKQSGFKVFFGTLPVKNISKWYILCFVLQFP